MVDGMAPICSVPSKHSQQDLFLALHQAMPPCPFSASALVPRDPGQCIHYKANQDTIQKIKHSIVPTDIEGDARYSILITFAVPSQSNVDKTIEDVNDPTHNVLFVPK
jgi:hypothetical protein